MHSLRVQDRTPLAWSADGMRLAFVSGSFGVYVLDMQGNYFRMARVLTGHRTAVRTLSFHPRDANILVSGGADGLLVWDIRRGEPLQTLSKAAGVAAAHESDVECVAWVHDGTALCTGSKDTTIKVWDTMKAPWRLLETITGHKAAVLSIKYCAAVQKLASAGRDSTIKIWDVATLAPDWRARRADDSGITCNLLGNLDGHRGDVVALTWLADGNSLLSGGRDNTTRLWSATTFLEIREMYDKKLGLGGKHRADVRRVTVLPDGIHVLTASLDGTVRVWRLKDTEGPASASRTDAAGASSSSPRGAAGADAAAGTGLGTPAGAAAGSAGAGATVGGLAADVGADATGSGWDDTTTNLLREILGDSTAAVDSRGPGTGEDACLHAGTYLNSDGVCEMELNSERPIVALSSSNNSVVLFALRLGAVALLDQQYDGTLPRGTLPPGTDVSPLLAVQAFHGHTGTVSAVALLPGDKTVVSGSTDYSVNVVEAETCIRKLTFKFGASVNCIAMGPSGLAATPSSAPVIFVGGADYSIKAYSSDPSDYLAIQQAYSRLAVPQPAPPHEYELARFVGHSGRVETMAIQAKSRLMISGARDFSLLLWNLPAGTLASPRAPREESGVPVLSPVARFEAHRGHVSALRFSSEDVEGAPLLASAGNDHCVKVWKLQPARGIMGPRLEEVWASTSSAVTLAGAQEPAPTRAAAGSSGHASAVSALAWGRADSSTGEFLFSGSWDHTIKVWLSQLPRSAGAGAPTPVATLVGHSSRVTGLDASSAGDLLVSVAADYTARVWRTRDPFPCIAIFNAALAEGPFTSVSAGTELFVTGGEAGATVWPLRSTGRYASYFRQQGQDALARTAGAAPQRTGVTVAAQAAGTEGSAAGTGLATTDSVSSTAGTGAGAPRPSNADVATPLLTGHRQQSQ